MVQLVLALFELCIFLFILNTQIIKTQTARIPDLSTFVEANHPYDVPEVINTRKAGNCTDKCNQLSGTSTTPPEPPHTCNEE